MIDYYRNNQDAAMQLQAPLYENKIVDFILSKVKLKKRTLMLIRLLKCIITSIQLKKLK